jgi:MFS family permease
MIELSSDNPFHSAFYYSTIIMYIATFGLIKLIIYIYKEKSETYKTRTLSTSLIDGKNYAEHLVNEKNTLKFKYLFAYLLTRASIWAKSPFLFMLYSTYHGFSTSEIGVLYVIDAVSGLISGPIFGSMADKYGRKLFCMCYCVFVSFNLCLRLTGSIPLAYVAQVLTGFGAGLINTTFESWVVCESKRIFRNLDHENEKYLKRLFKNQNLYDAIISLGVSAVSAIIFTHFGIFVTLLVSVFYSSLAFFVILFLWEENKLKFINKGKKGSSFWTAFKELKKREVFSIGMIESLFQTSLNLFLFLWTPLLLKSTSYTQINVGFCFVCFVIMMIIGTTIFELSVIILKTDYYINMAGSLFLGTVMWFFVYTDDSFLLRMVYLSIINV